MSFKSKMNLFSLLSLIGLANIQAQDWADLDRFKEDNHELSLVKQANDRIVFMGNSITIGWLNLRPEFFEGKPYVNRGISGQTTPQMLIRFRQDVVDLHPKAVVLLAGTNDIAGNTGPSTIEMIMDNIKGMSEIAKANDIKVILSSTLPAYDYPWKPGLEPSGKIIALNKMIKIYAAAQGHIYLDYFSTMVDNRNGLPKKYADDEVHPTVAGYKVMEPLVEAAIEKALRQ
jgi:lysophospholipase L1-like esterase